MLKIAREGDGSAGVMVQHARCLECLDLMIRARGGHAWQASDDHGTWVQYSRCCSSACLGPRSEVSGTAADEQGVESWCQALYHFQRRQIIVQGTACSYNHVIGWFVLSDCPKQAAADVFVIFLRFRLGRVLIDLSLHAAAGA